MVSFDGSSPLTRGKPSVRNRRAVKGRLIPAHAGKTAASASEKTPAWAHPRSRGENVSGAIGQKPPLGSSPLTRGKPPHAPAIAVRPGLIPAHAGKTDGASVGAREEQAHPRSRGENVLGPLLCLSDAGSSPLTRGKLGQRIDVAVNRGLIPAHAGKTPRFSTERARAGAHPRSRGENRGVAWGRGGAGGLIPAHAGKTCATRARSGRLAAHPRSRGENTS